ncbi:MAG: hypothetical protein Q8Q07_02430 [Dehalococcoidales bacterium]|nr:hypothetical protein [Dehalococcoidales bacterium]
MSQQTDELTKLVAVATDMVMDRKLRANAIKLIGDIGSHEALLSLLSLAANEQLTRKDRELALKYAMSIVKAGK